MPLGPANRLIWALMLLLLAVLAYKTSDDLETYFAGVGQLDVGEMTTDGTVVMRWRGQIDAPMESRIRETFENSGASARKFVLVLSSPGGALGHGGRVVALLRKISETHAVETVVEAGRRCASMCVPVYLQGQRRSAAASAKFMFHEVSFKEYVSEKNIDMPDSAKASATDKLFADYFKPAGVAAAWIQKVRADMSGGNDIWKTAAELVEEQAGVVQEVRD
jgi:hypothetical protein